MIKVPNRNRLVIGLLFVQSLLTFSCQKEVGSETDTQGDATLQIRFTPVVDGMPLVFGSQYTNSSGESYAVNTFKFYVHAIELQNVQTNATYRLGRNEHFLINQADTATSHITLRIPSTSYNLISFNIGVDSARNTTGAQTGALDPAQGMFWTWSTGYIMAKFEGSSPVANTPNNVIEYHIGGFKAAESVVRRITLPIQASQKLHPEKGKLTSLIISANINSWFGGAGNVRIRQNPVSMTPGPLATQIADNYANMFSVVEIIHE